MTQKQEQIFFALLRRALFPAGLETQLASNDDAVLDAIVPHTDWEPLLTAYIDNALLGVVAYAIRNLPQRLQPSLRQNDSIISYTWKLTLGLEKMHHAIASSFQLIGQTGATPVLLKGEGLSTLYPKQSLRALGDIDVMVEEAHFETVCMAIDEANGIQPDSQRYRADCEHHYHTTFGDTQLEIHHSIADEAWDYKAQQLNLWADCQLYTGLFRHTVIDGQQILLPPVQFDIFYIFQHLGKHVLNEGGGLRQIVDWGLYLHTVFVQQLPYDRLTLHQTLCNFRYIHPWQVLSGILHHQLGIPVEEIPFYDERKARKSQTIILSDMIAGGNFGKATCDTGETLLPHGIKRTILVLRQMLSNYRRKRILFPRTAFIALCRDLTVGVKCIVNR